MTTTHRTKVRHWPGCPPVHCSQWLELRLQLIGCAVVAGVAIIAVIQHHIAGADPGLAGLAISYVLGITGKLSGLVNSHRQCNIDTDRHLQDMIKQ